MAKERCIRVCAVHGRRWDVGEIREIDTFDADGMPVVTPHFRLVEEEESVDPAEVHGGEELQRKLEEAAAIDKEVAVNRALEKLDPRTPTATGRRTGCPRCRGCATSRE